MPVLSPNRRTGPAVQASYMKNVFAALEKQGRLDAVAREAPELAREVGAASRMSWLPIAWNVRLRLLGTEPGSLGRFLPQAFSLVFRDCGRWSVESGAEHELRVEVRELPEPLAAHRLWLRSLAIGMLPLFTLCGTDGESELVQRDARGRRASYRLRWKPPG